MSTPAHHVHYTLAEYLAFERSSGAKHEYFDGQIYAMAGGGREHARLANALAVMLGGQLLGGRCSGYSSGLRVRIPATGLDTYPDLTIICGPARQDPEDEHAVNNPTLLVEVLSSGTEKYDRGEKFEHYKRLESLRQYVLVDPLAETVEVWTLADGTWSSPVHSAGEVAELGSVNAKLDVRELFEAAAEPLA